MTRILCQFSCGAASAVATKLILGEYGRAGLLADVLIFNAYLKEEHPDNQRFKADCERWFDHPITQLRNAKYDGSARAVFKGVRYMNGQHGAPCTRVLKRELLDSHRLPTDTLVLGYTMEEEDRYDQFLDRHPGEKVRVPLIEAKLSKADCLAMVERAGIVLPAMYLLGYDNNNCIGCVKGGEGYWNKVRRDFPADFEEMAQIQETIGPGAYLFRHRSGPLKGQRYSLRELPANKGRYSDEPKIECSFFCEAAEKDFTQ